MCNPVYDAQAKVPGKGWTVYKYCTSHDEAVAACIEGVLDKRREAEWRVTTPDDEVSYRFTRTPEGVAIGIGEGT